MKIRKICYLVPPADLIDDRLDVFVTLEDEHCIDGFSYVLEVTTPQCLLSIMEESESGFLPPGYPYIIVSKLSDAIIRAAVQSFIDSDDDSFWLKLYHTTATLNVEDLNQILHGKKKEDAEIDARIDAEIDAEFDAESDINQ